MTLYILGAGSISPWLNSFWQTYLPALTTKQRHKISCQETQLQMETKETALSTR